MLWRAWGGDVNVGSPDNRGGQRRIRGCVGLRRRGRDGTDSRSQGGSRIACSPFWPMALVSTRRWLSGKSDTPVSFSARADARATTFIYVLQ